MLWSSQDTHGRSSVGPVWDDQGDVRWTARKGWLWGCVIVFASARRRSSVPTPLPLPLRRVSPCSMWRPPGWTPRGRGSSRSRSCTPMCTGGSFTAGARGSTPAFPCVPPTSMGSPTRMSPAHPASRISRSRSGSLCRASWSSRTMPSSTWSSCARSSPVPRCRCRASPPTAPCRAARCTCLSCGGALSPSAARRWACPISRRIRRSGTRRRRQGCSSDFWRWMRRPATTPRSRRRGHCVRQPPQSSATAG